MRTPKQQPIPIPTPTPKPDPNQVRTRPEPMGPIESAVDMDDESDAEKRCVVTEV